MARKIEKKMLWAGDRGRGAEAGGTGQEAEAGGLDTHPRAISTFPHPHPKSDGSYPKTILNKILVGVGFASFAFKIREIRFLKIRT
jgi:hypothetical protein